MKHPILIAALSVATTACVAGSDDDRTSVVEDELTLTGSSPAACSLPTPGTAHVVAIEREGVPVNPSTLTSRERYELALVAAHHGVYGDGDVSCDFENHGGAGFSLICTNKVTGTTCGFHYWATGPEVGCDDPEHPTC